MARHVEGSQGREGGAIAVGHAEAAVRPEGVVIAIADVHPAVGGLPKAIDAVAPKDQLVEVPGLGHAVHGVHGGGLTVGGRGGGLLHVVQAIAPGGGGVGVDGAHSRGVGGGVVAVGDVVAAGASGQVPQLEAGGGGVHIQGHGARVLALAGGGCGGGVEGVPALKDGAGVGVHQIVRVPDAVQVVLQLRVDVVSQRMAQHLAGEGGGVNVFFPARPEGAAHHRGGLGVHHQLGGGREREGALGGQVLLDHGQGFPLGHGRGDVQLDVAVQGVGQGQLRPFPGHMGDGVATPHPHALVALDKVAVGLAQLIGVGIPQLEGVVLVEPELKAVGGEAVRSCGDAPGLFRGAGAQRP